MSRAPANLGGYVRPEISTVRTASLTLASSQAWTAFTDGNFVFQEP